MTTMPRTRAGRTCQSQRASRRRDGRGRLEGVPQVEREGQERRPEQSRDLHRPDGGRADRDRRRVGGRRQERVADRRHAQGRRPIPEQEGDHARRRGPGPAGRLRPAGRRPAPSAPGAARPPGTVAATPTNAEERDDQDGHEHGRPAHPRRALVGATPGSAASRARQRPDDQAGHAAAPGTSTGRTARGGSRRRRRPRRRPAG